MAIGKSNKTRRRRLRRAGEKTYRRERTRRLHREPSVENEDKARRRQENQRDSDEELIKWGVS